MSHVTNKSIGDAYTLTIQEKDYVAVLVGAPMLISRMHDTH